ncbi:MAG: type II secretion system F family protein [Burkholderiaceae bacterium]|nr:type II secretion system F family protein [Microbacteriaceae bacterium]
MPVDSTVELTVASTVQRLAVLLAAGVPPASSWRYLSSASSPTGAQPSIASSVAAAAEGGIPIADAIIAAVGGSAGHAAGGASRGGTFLGGASRGAARASDLEGDAWRGLAAAWQVATEAGAPLAPTLAEFAGSLRSLAAAQRDVDTALAGPRATSRVVMALPVVGIFFGLVLGFDTVGALVTTFPGTICLVLGTLLFAGGGLWTRLLVRRARPTTSTPGLDLDLTAVAVSGGSSIPRALEAVAAAVDRFGLTRGGSAEAIADVLDLSFRAGVPAAALLRSEAEEFRRRARSDAERRASSLSVTLMLPLGVCVLPSFMLLGVAPLVISVITSTISGF